MTRRRLDLGRSGEDAVARWYQERGYEVVARNWRCREGELDLILRTGRTYVFCEVKTRSSDAFGAPVEAVGRAKQVRVRHLAGLWLADQSGAGQRPSDQAPSGLRFDVASVLAGVVEVVEGAF